MGPEGSPEGGCRRRRVRAMHKLIFRAASLLACMVGGLLASAIFKKAWQLAAGEDEAPKATDSTRGWHEILIAAALQGAIFATVRAAVDQPAAAGTHSLTRTWPGEGGTGKDRKKAEKA